MLIAQVAHGQLVVNENLNPQQLVEDVLIGPGIQVSNFQFVGDPRQRGYFDGSNSNIGVAEGIIIATGRIEDASGPNGTPNTDFGTDFSRPGDGQLSSIAGSPTFDAAALSFDFVPTSDTVTFRYVFASNEYMDYVGQSVNDVFAFLISGPGIVGEQNVALIPGTAAPVTIDDVNANVNSQFYVDNENPPGSTVEYNGFTQVLTAQAFLQSCQTYRIRLAVADGGDGTFDSAVFLEGGSFRSPSININAESNYSASADPDQYQLVEGCSNLSLTFERSEPFDNALSIGLDFSGTVTNGVDITSIPPFITFNPGEATTTLSFNVLEDGDSSEGVENMTITIDQVSCASSTASSITFSIEDVAPMNLQITPDSPNLTCPEERTIDLEVTGGYEPFVYSWTGSTDTDESIDVFPFQTTTYTATVSDACGFQESASSTVSLQFTYQPMSVAVSDAVACAGDSVTLTPTVTGGRVPVTFEWPDGSTDPTYSFVPQVDEQVTLLVTDACNITDTAAGNVEVDQVIASFTHQLAGHATVQFTTNTVDVFNFSWDFGDDSTSTGSNPRHEYQEAGDYEVQLTVVNRNGCDTTLTDSVTVYDPLRVYIPNSFTPNEDGLNDTWGVIGQGYLYYDMEIYDRWGKRLMEGRFTDDEAWDGTFNGQKVPTGLYVYKVWVQPPIGIEFKESDILNVLSGE